MQLDHAGGPEYPSELQPYEQVEQRRDHSFSDLGHITRPPDRYCGKVRPFRTSRHKVLPSYARLEIPIAQRMTRDGKDYEAALSPLIVYWL
jgi:hypothetical protein